MGEGSPSFMQASLWGSIMPAVWSFMLAARERALGTVWTTLHLPQEQEAADGRPVLASEHTFPAHRTEFVVDLATSEPSIAPSGLRLVEEG